MNTPWQVLGITPGCSVDEVKRAYAKLLRQHRPDVDPVGFRRVRDAYEFALRAAESGWASGSNDDDDEVHEVDEVDSGDDARDAAAATPPPPPSPSLPGAQPTWLGWLEAGPTPPPAAPVSARPRPLANPLRAALARARATRRTGREQRLLGILADALRTRPDEPDLVELGRDELRPANNAFRRRLRPADTLTAPAYLRVPLVRSLLLAHVTAADWQTLWDAVRAIETATTNGHDATGGAAMHEAARIVALLEPTFAERLVDAAFRLSAAARAELAELDAWILAGKQLHSNAFWDDKRQIVLALCDPAARSDEGVGKRAIAISRETLAAPMVGALLVQRFPEAAPRFDDVEWEEKPHQARRRRQRRRGDEQQRSPLPMRLLVIFFVVLAQGARFCVAPPSRATPPRIERILERHQGAQPAPRTLDPSEPEPFAPPRERR